MDTLLRIVALLFIFSLLSERSEAGQSFLCAGFPPGGMDRASAKVARSTMGKDHPVVIFAAFNGALPAGTPAPAYAGSIFDPNVEGSFSHFYQEMSFGALTIEGTWLPKIYLSKRGSEGYGGGGYSLFNQEIFEAADAEIDFSQYDNDGPDGKPNSGDDDGIVDFVFIDVLGEIPPNFIKASATGIAGLGLGQFVTNDESVAQRRISIRDGTTQRVLGFRHAVGSMAHEYGHILGLPDLYDTSFMDDPRQPPEDDAAGIGAWGLMGLGAQGWNGDDGPNPFSAWEREKLGWIGRNNDRLVTVTGRLSNVAVDDVEMGGLVYKLPVSDQEYFLIENRQRGGGYYDRNIPGEGLLIWHINLFGSQGDETRKAVDLECADGLFTDKGHPDGTQSDPVAGRDNLDFWAHDETYSKTHRGNTGDATDAFDGERYTAFNGGTNPNSNAYDIDEDRTGTGRQEISSRISVTNIRRQGLTMLTDLSSGYWSGRVSGKSVWQGTVHVSGDLTIEPGAELTILPGAIVEVESSDDQHGGLDSSQVEIAVAGTLKTPPSQLSGTIRLKSQGRWYGIRILGRSARVELQNVRIEEAVNGISGSEGGRVRLNSFIIRESSQNGIHLTEMNGTVELWDGTIENNGEDGISIAGEGIVDVRRVVVQKNAGTGVTTAGVRLRVEGASIQNNASTGIVARQGALIIQQSKILRNAGGGISIEEASIECKDNSFERDNEGFAMQLVRITGGVVQGNTFSLGRGAGIRIVSSPMFSNTLLVIDNLFEDNDVGSSTISSTPTLSGNTFRGNQTAVLCEGESTPVIAFNKFIANEWAVRSTARQTVPATNNWWGTDNATEIGSRMSGDVSWQPFLIASPEDPRGIILGRSFPNPFSHILTIPYQVSYQRSIHVLLSIYDTTGQMIRVLVNETTSPGRHNAMWDGRDGRGREVANGVYLCKIAVRSQYRAEETMTVRMMVVR